MKRSLNEIAGFFRGAGYRRISQYVHLSYEIILNASLSCEFYSPSHDVHRSTLILCY